MTQLKAIHILPGETRIVVSDWTAECEERGTTVSSSTWDGGGLTLTSPALSFNAAAVKVSPADCSGTAILTNTATLANGEVLVSEREVVVSKS